MPATLMLDRGALNVAAAAVDDLEHARMAHASRVRELRDGFGFDASAFPVLTNQSILDGLASIEAKAIANLQKAVRQHPLWDAYAKGVKGLGEKQFGRLLASIGDPYWHFQEDRPRTVGELWAYCGLHVQADGKAPHRRPGQKANWSSNARQRVFLISGSLLKAQGPLTDIYYARREQDAEAIHATDCIPCGPKGTPASAGSPLSAAHQHGRAMRQMGKELLRQLWLAARELHEGSA